MWYRGGVLSVRVCGGGRSGSKSALAPISATLGGAAGGVCVAVLAAGASRRMGSCKMALPLGDSTVLGRAMDTALCCDGADEVVVVTGAHRDEVAPIIEAYAPRAQANPSPHLRGPVELHNAEWHLGQSASVRCAARHALRGGFDALVVMVADQPFVRPAHLDALIGCFRGDGGAHQVFRSASGSNKGNPCLFARPVFERLLSLSGDEGARTLFRQGELRACDVRFDDPLMFVDLDAPEDVAWARAVLSRATERSDAHAVR